MWWCVIQQFMFSRSGVTRSKLPLPLVPLQYKHTDSRGCVLLCQHCVALVGWSANGIKECYKNLSVLLSVSPHRYTFKGTCIMELYSNVPICNEINIHSSWFLFYHTGNVALYKAADQSGRCGVCGDDGFARQGVDGKLPTSDLENCAHPDGNSGQWWVDLGGLFQVFNVTIYFRKSDCKWNQNKNKIINATLVLVVSQIGSDIFTIIGFLFSYHILFYRQAIWNIFPLIFPDCVKKICILKFS